MNKIIRISLGMLLLLLSRSLIACDYPDRVLIPNGNTATRDDMLAAQNAVKKFVADMDVYLECIVEEEKAARDAIEDLQPEEEEEREQMLNKKYNAADDERVRIAAQFNAEVQAFKAKSTQ